MCLPVPRNGFAALYVELKRSRGGSLSKAQRAWHERLRDAGNRVEVCHGANRAIEIISGYLGLA